MCWIAGRVPDTDLSIASWLSLRFLASVLLYSLISSKNVLGVVYTWRRSVS